MEQAKKYLVDFANGTSTMFKEFFNKKTRKKQIANMISFSRLLITLPILVLSILAIINASAPLLITNCILVGLGAFTDAIDGRIARKYGYTSEYGKKLDQITDKAFSIIAAGTLSILNPIFILPILGESLIMASTLPFALKHKNIKDNSEFIGRIKQWPLGVSFFLGYLSPLNATINLITMLLVSITLELQLGSAIVYLNRGLNSVKEMKKDKLMHALEQETPTAESDELTKTIGEKKNIENNNEATISQARTELYIALKKLKEQLISNQECIVNKTKVKK